VDIKPISSGIHVSVGEVSKDTKGNHLEPSGVSLSRDKKNENR